MGQHSFAFDFIKYVTASSRPVGPNCVLVDVDENDSINCLFLIVHVFVLGAKVSTIQCGR